MAQTRKACWPALALALLGLALLGLWQTVGPRAQPGAPAALTARSEAAGAAALTAAGFPWARVEIRGGVAHLVGDAPNPAAHAAAFAALQSALADHRGVPGVFARFANGASLKGGAAPAAPPAAPAPPTPEIAATTPPPPESAPPAPAPSAPPAAAPVAQAAAAPLGLAACRAGLRRQLGAARISFSTDAAELAPRSQAALARLADLVGRCAAHRIVIAGHTDRRGAAAYNQALSLRRAEAVRAALAANGAPAEALEVRGEGERRPLDLRRGPRADARNRRIEIIVTAR